MLTPKTIGQRLLLAKAEQEGAAGALETQVEFFRDLLKRAQNEGDLAMNVYLAGLMFFVEDVSQKLYNRMTPEEEAEIDAAFDAMMRVGDVSPSAVLNEKDTNGY